VRRLPDADFHSAGLDLTRVAAGARYVPICHWRYPDPLGYGKTPSRFSDPRRRITANRFGVLYLGISLKVCFIEAVLRDQRDGVVGDFPIDEAELRNRQYAEIEVESESGLNLVDLTGDGAVRMGMPSDVLRGSRQGSARHWSLAFHTHPAVPDGIMYPSRLNGETNLAIYDRTISKLSVAGTCELINAPCLAAVLTDLRVGLIRT
jgi:hypothetical protein